MALEMLFIVGDLMIDRRESFQRVYDLRECVLPEWDDSRTPDIEAVQRTLTLAAAQALGAAPARWLADYFRTSKAETAHIAAALAAEGALTTARVEGWRDPVYIHPDNLPLAQAAAAGALRSTVTTLLSPFDPVVWDRQRALELFGFDYLIGGNRADRLLVLAQFQIKDRQGLVFRTFHAAETHFGLIIQPAEPSADLAGIVFLVGPGNIQKVSLGALIGWKYCGTWGAAGEWIPDAPWNNLVWEQEGRIYHLTGQEVPFEELVSIATSIPRKEGD